jgi:mRNA-degrading endonuclease YafQ of YafQ-DinJ toxin-antitoxin module
MRGIDWTSQFKRDYKREGKGQHRVTLDEDLFTVVEDLANDMVLDQKFCDHVFVPTRLFKLVHDQSTKRAWTHVLPNTADARRTKPIDYTSFVRLTRWDVLTSQEVH